ncbi:hypothetical protein H4R21_003341 [Coemansia helicoidea]|uniref:Uncharacterized protein n=1 Tax=Coemansia helicoidea TaxID=1286919 RepID=A0ACC1L425_9FUNG|nr:hypothetical protein H4R21_003341 [Coemansia helicoidea]
MTDRQLRSDTPPALRLPELVMRRVFRYLVDIPAFEWFEDPGLLDTWSRLAKQLLRLLRVCRYWRELACPLYYQYAAGCIRPEGYRFVAGVRNKARIHEIAAPHRATVRYVYLYFSIEGLLGKKSQDLLDGILGDAVFPDAQQLIIEVDKDKGPLDEQTIARVKGLMKAGLSQKDAEAKLPDDIDSRISYTCARLREAFPNVVATQVLGTIKFYRKEAMAQFTHRMVEGRTVVSLCPGSCHGVYAPEQWGTGLTWIKIDRNRFGQTWMWSIRFSAATLQTIIVTRGDTCDIEFILPDATNGPLVYPRLRELRIELRGGWVRQGSREFERAGYTPFPVLERVSVTPMDLQIDDLLLRGNRASLVQVRLYLSGGTVTRLHRAGLLDHGKVRPALRRIELYGQFWGSDDVRSDDSDWSGGNESVSDWEDDGRDTLSQAVFEQFVRWVLMTARDCSRIVLRGWRMQMRLGSGGLEPLVTRLGGAVRHLDLPVMCTVADALWLVKQLPSLDYLGIALDGFRKPGDRMPVARYVRTAVAAQQSRLRTLAVPISPMAGALQKRHIALMRGLAELVPGMRTLKLREAHDDVERRRPNTAALLDAAKAVRADLAVRLCNDYPLWP